MEIFHLTDDILLVHREELLARLERISEGLFDIDVYAHSLDDFIEELGGRDADRANLEKFKKK